MDYFRRRPGFALLALLALAAQIILPFGHVHLLAPQGETGAIAQGICDGARQHCPQPGGNDRHFCPLCAAMGSAGFLILPAPVVLSLLDLGGSGIVARSWTLASPGERPCAFDARAPPLPLTV